MKSSTLKVAAILVFLQFTINAPAQDLLRISSTSAVAGSTADVGVWLGTADSAASVRDRKPIHGISFKILFARGVVEKASFERAGSIKRVTPVFERTFQTSDSLAYIGFFDEPLLIASTTFGERIGTIRLQLSSELTPETFVQVRFDPPSVALADASGTSVKTLYSREMRVESASISIHGDSTVTTVSSSANPASVGQLITLIATVDGLGKPMSGAVAFLDNGQPFGYAEVRNGLATLTTSILGSGAHNIAARFEGNETNLPSVSQTLHLTVEVARSRPVRR